MIYHLSLQLAGIITGVALLAYSLYALANAEAARQFARTLPRSGTTGVALLTIDLIWCFWLIATMEMGEFAAFRKPLLIALPIAFFLVLRFVNEFLAVRALGIFFLLAAEPLLEAAFLRYESSRLLVTFFAYALIVAGMFWVAAPYLLRDQINWAARNGGRWRGLHSFTLLYAIAVLVCAFTQY